MQKKPDTWTSFFQNALLLIIGFILTTVVGAGLTDYYQNRAARKALILSDAQANLAEQKAFFMTISPLMDERIFRMWKLQQFFSNSPSDNNELQDRIANYRIPYVEWNGMLNENLALYSYYFSDAALTISAPKCAFSNPPRSQEIDLQCIQDGFIETNVALDNVEADYRDKSSSFQGDLIKYEADLNTLNPQIFMLDQLMLKALLSNRKQFEDQLSGGYEW